MRLSWLPARLLVGPHQFDDRLLPIADDESVYKANDRLRVERRVAASDDERVPFVPLAGPQWESRQIKHLQQVGVELLVRQAEANDVKIGQGPLAFQAVKRDARLTHRRDHIHPRHVGSLGQHVRQCVEYVVEDRQPQVGHSQVIDIGEGQTDADGRGFPVLDNTVVLAADVAARLLHRGQDTLQPFQVNLHHTCPAASNRQEAVTSLPLW